jgi:hypothetical protein
VFQRVSYTGGIEDYLARLYQLRFGTFAESPEENAFIAVAGVLSLCGIGFLGLAMLAWIRGQLTIWEKFTFSLLAVLLFLAFAASTFRGTMFFGIISLIAVYDSERRIGPLTLATCAGLLLCFLIALNYAHQYLYYLTAGWDYSTLTNSLHWLLAPHGHFETLAWVLDASDHTSNPLFGQGWTESILFFLPRLLWVAKAPTSDFGTLLVQSWAGLPDWYQMAITDVGELIAHFGYIGMVGMVVYGWLYARLDSFWDRTDELRCALFCILLPRVLAGAGMGLSATAISLFTLLLFLGAAYALRSAK